MVRFTSPSRSLRFQGNINPRCVRPRPCRHFSQATDAIAFSLVPVVESRTSSNFGSHLRALVLAPPLCLCLRLPLAHLAMRCVRWGISLRHSGLSFRRPSPGLLALLAFSPACVFARPCAGAAPSPPLWRPVSAWLSSSISTCCFCFTCSYSFRCSPFCSCLGPGQRAERRRNSPWRCWPSLWRTRGTRARPLVRLRGIAISRSSNLKIRFCFGSVNVVNVRIESRFFAIRDFYIGKNRKRVSIIHMVHSVAGLCC